MFNLVRLNLCTIFLLLLFLVFSINRPALAQYKTSLLKVQPVGNPQSVFDTKTQACEPTDIPDSDARAFRDADNQVHLFSTHYVNRAMIGPDLDHLSHQCQVSFRSLQDPDPSHFSDYSWLNSFYTLDGNTVVALVHNEYHAWKYPGMLNKKVAPDVKGHGWWNTISFAVSRDGGRTFSEPPSPQNLIASASRAYDPDNEEGATGFFQPTNIISHEGNFYALINTWNGFNQKTGSCLIRTNNIFQPTSWRAWDGSAFSFKFNDPYGRERQGPATGSQTINTVCEPVFDGHADGLVYHPASGYFLMTTYAADTRYGEPGIYLYLSKDLIHWGNRVLALSKRDLEKSDGQGKWSYGYPTLIDPNSPDRNFGTVSDAPLLYYVRFDMLHAPLTRTLKPWKVRLAFP